MRLAADLPEARVDVVRLVAVRPATRFAAARLAPTRRDAAFAAARFFAITHHIDVSQHADAKRRAIASHASQANDTGFATEMSEDSFLRAFGTEWFIKVGEPAPSRRTTLLD